MAEAGGSIRKAGQKQAGSFRVGSPRPQLLRGFTKERERRWDSQDQDKTLRDRFAVGSGGRLPTLSSEPAPSSPRPWTSARRDPPGQFQIRKGENGPRIWVRFLNDPTTARSVTWLNDLTRAHALASEVRPRDHTGCGMYELRSGRIRAFGQTRNHAAAPGSHRQSG